MLASDPADQERPAYFSGIPAGINDPEGAIRVCSAAGAGSPDNLRLQHNLARAYAQHGDHERPFAKFITTAKAGYASSMLSLAEYLLDAPTEALRSQGRDWLR